MLVVSTSTVSYSSTVICGFSYFSFISFLHCTAYNLAVNCFYFAVGGFVVHIAPCVPSVADINVTLVKRIGAAVGGFN